MRIKGKSKSRLVFASAVLFAAVLCFAAFAVFGWGIKSAKAETEASAESYELQLSNEYKNQNSVIMETGSVIDIERTCSHVDGRAGDMNGFTAVFDTAAAEGKIFKRLWVYTRAYGGRWAPTDNLDAVSGKPVINDNDGTTYSWAGRNLGDNAAGTVHQTPSIVNNPTGGIYLNNSNGLNLDNNSKSWYVFEIADNSALQSAAGSAAGLQTLKSFTWQINHFQVTSHIAYGDIYGETASGEKVRLFNAATAEVKASDDNAEEGNYIFKSGNQASCFTVKKITAKNNFSTASSDGGWREFSVPFANLPTDLSDYAGFSFYINNPADKPIFFNKFLTERTATAGLVNKDNGNTPYGANEKERWYDNVNVGNYIPDGGSLEHNQRIQTIPAGYKGRVIVPFSAFVTPSWKTLPDNASRLDLNDVDSLSFSFNVSDAYAKTEFELNDFKLESYVEVPVSLRVNYQWADGMYKEAVSYRRLYNDGAEFDLSEAQSEVTFNGQSYVLDESLSKYEAEDGAAYVNGVPRVRRNGGAVSYSYAPKLFYKLKGGFKLEKAFYPKAIAGELPYGSNVDEIVESLPGGFTFGNQYGGLMEIKGTWSVTDKSESGATFVFTPAEIPSDVTVSDSGVFTVHASISAVRPALPPVTGIKINTPMKTTFMQGGKLELAGLIVTATFEDGTTAVLDPADYTVTGFDASAVGEQTITVTSGDKTATFKITVLENPDYKPQGGDGTNSGCNGKEFAGMLALAAVVMSLAVIKKH